MTNFNVDEPTGEGPLRDFWGIGLPIEREVSKFEGRETVRGVFKFTDVEPLKVVDDDVFPFDVYEFKINYSNPHASRNKETKWEYMAESVRTLGLKGSAAFDAIANKRQHWIMVIRDTRARNDETGEWEPVPTLVWTLKEVEGIDASPVTIPQATNTSTATAPTPTKAVDKKVYLAKLADGKTETEFNTAAMADANVRKWTTEVDAITDRILLGEYVELGLLERNAEGVYHTTTLVPA